MHAGRQGKDGTAITGSSRPEPVSERTELIAAKRPFAAFGTDRMTVIYEFHRQ
jgi:hypothetical protein